MKQKLIHLNSSIHLTLMWGKTIPKVPKTHISPVKKIDAALRYRPFTPEINTSINMLFQLNWYNSSQNLIYWVYLTNGSHRRVNQRTSYISQIGLTSSVLNKFVPWVCGSWIFCQNKAMVAGVTLTENSRIADFCLRLFLLILMASSRQLCTDPT